MYLLLLINLKNYRVEIPGSAIGSNCLNFFYDKFLPGAEVANKALLLVSQLLLDSAVISKPLSLTETVKPVTV